MTIATKVTVVKEGNVPASMNSNLEAFSHNPTDDFAGFAFSQLHYQISEPTVPLVLSWITVRTSVCQ
ncbi:hypothetical protein ACHAWX_000050 [Stephanocyclus meneghinianus]